MVRQDSIGSMYQQPPQATIIMQEDEYGSVFLQKHVYSTHKKVQREWGGGGDSVQEIGELLFANS